MIIFREAKREDLERIVQLLADDMLGTGREDMSIPLHQAYEQAFDAISKDKHNELIVAEWDEKVVGVCQLTYIPYLTYRGSWRAIIEGVRIASEYREKGLGEALIKEAIIRAKAKGVRIVQLTTDKQRSQAKHFYEKIGFKATHEGMKLNL